jgi:hypothetical protein
LFTSPLILTGTAYNSGSLWAQLIPGNMESNGKTCAEGKVFTRIFGPKKHEL